MPQLLIWGDPRAILGGELPPGLATETVSSLAGVAHAVDGRGPALVLADVRCLDAERDAAAAWAKDGAAGHAVLVAVADSATVDEALARLPFVEDVIAGPVTTTRLQHLRERAIEAVNARRSVRQLEAALARKGAELSELNKIGVALSAERNIEKLLELILAKSREITGADAGSLYLVESAAEGGGGDRVRFELAQNDTVAVSFQKFTMPLDDASIAGHVALTGLPLNVADAYRLPEDSPFQISRAFDARSGYRTKSVLVVPMRDHEKATIGVVQLINKKRNPEAVLQPVALVEEEVVPFTAVDEELVVSLASQAAVAYENADAASGGYRGSSTSSSTRGVRGRAARPDDRRPLGAGGDAHRGPRPAAWTASPRGPSPRPSSPASRSMSCATRRSSTTSARWRCRRSTCARRRSSTRPSSSRSDSASPTSSRPSRPTYLHARLEAVRAGRTPRRAGGDRRRVPRTAPGGGRTAC